MSLLRQAFILNILNLFRKEGQVMNEINEYRAKKEGRTTPKELINNLMDAITSGEIDCVVYITRDKEGIIETGWSDIVHTEAIGLIEIGKQKLIDDMRE